MRGGVCGGGGCREGSVEEPSETCAPTGSALAAEGKPLLQVEATALAVAEPACPWQCTPLDVACRPAVSCSCVGYGCRAELHTRITGSRRRMGGLTEI